ncbi:MAG: DUF3293 domain-containing protein [Oceanococcus sp.]
MTRIAELQQAYANTRYVALLGESSRFTLRPGHSNAALDAWMQVHGVECLHMLSACNPRSQAFSAAWNQHAMLNLKLQLQAFKWDNWPCSNQAIADDWPEEESLIIGGREQLEILLLAEQLGQYAVLEHRIGQASQLIYTALFSADQSHSIAEL